MPYSEPQAEPELARDQVTAEAAGLRSSDLSAPGWRRVKCGRGWRYLGTRGQALLGPSRARCKGLVIPPAWRDVWISPDARGHIQAAGTDAAGRRQYLYHPLWQQTMSAAKFEDLPLFASRLPRLRAALRRRLSAPRNERDFALAVIAGLLDCGGLRIGHRRYRRITGSIGATTLQARHVRTGPEGVTLAFPGKSGQPQTVLIEDAEIAAALTDLKEAATRDLFALEEGRITAGAVNQFISGLIGPGFTSKDFRTWGGSVAATRALVSLRDPSTAEVARLAADWLGNTPAVARAAYIHPAILEAASLGVHPTHRAGPSRLRADERTCFALITRRDVSERTEHGNHRPGE
jgi:DNA topoisomerase I